MGRSAFLSNNKQLQRDYIFGNRCKGIVAYGVMPATLVYLGVVKVEQVVYPSYFGVWEILSFFIVMLIPLAVLYKLINHRLQKYYLFLDYSRARSVLITFEIFIGSILICLATGTLAGKYVFTLQISRWSIIPLLESFLGGIATLAVSSTLFASMLHEEGDVPGLPTKDFLDEISAIKKNYRMLTSTKGKLEWNKEPTINPQFRINIDEFVIHLKTINTLSKGKYGIGEAVKELQISVEYIKVALADIERGGKWQKYFTDDCEREKKIEEMATNIKQFLFAQWSF